MAVEAGVIYGNPAAAAKRVKVPTKPPALPSREKFNAMVEEMRNGHGRFSRDCADFVEGLAYSGMRKGEANVLEWRNLDFAASEIVVRGDAVTGTKGGEGWRPVPMIADARTLFERLRSERPGESLDAKYSVSANARRRSIGQLRKSAPIASPITICGIYSQRSASKSNVDIPTVSRWLGHKDGGVLAMKTYGHLRREHSQAQALKVSFSPVPKSADIVPFSVEA